MKVSKDKKRKALTKKKSAGKDAKVPRKKTPSKVKVAPKKAQPKKTTPAKAARAKPARTRALPAKVTAAKATPAKAAPARVAPVKVPLPKVAPKKAPKFPARPEAFRKAFMESLVEKREELKEAIERLISSRKEYNGQLTAGDFIDEVDDAQREISAYGHYSLIERKNRELQKIEYLIERIVKEEEGFGLCEECGASIPRERLMVVPEATLCVNCQREIEKLDQRKAMAAKVSSGLGSPTRREVSWENPEPVEEEENVLVEYQIGTLPDVDIEEPEPESPSEEKEEK